MAGVFGQCLYACKAGRVAGLRLLPFSANHAQLLLEIESPYIKGRTGTVGETTEALIACMSNRKCGMNKVWRFSNSVIVRLAWRLWWAFHDHTEVAEDLREWIASSVKHPEMWVEDGEKGKSTGAPWPFYIVSLIAQDMPSIPYNELWDMPISELACHKAIIDERSGGAEIADNSLAYLQKLKAGDSNG